MRNTSVVSIGICNHRKLSLHHLPRRKGLLSPVHRWNIWLDALALPLWFARAPLNWLAPLTLLHFRLTGFCYPFLCDTLHTLPLLRHITMQGITSCCNNFVAVRFSPLVCPSPLTSPLPTRILFQLMFVLFPLTFDLFTSPHSRLTQTRIERQDQIGTRTVS